jgi:hypothetical protein
VVPTCIREGGEWHRRGGAWEAGKRGERHGHSTPVRATGAGTGVQQARCSSRHPGANTTKIRFGHGNREVARLRRESFYGEYGGCYAYRCGGGAEDDEEGVEL